MSDSKKSSPKAPLQLYESLVAAGDLNPDMGQYQAVQALQQLYIDLQKLSTKSWSPWKPKVIPKGAYLFGGVGRGKTMLMDLFFMCLPDGDKQRLHFHDFMMQAHNLINLARKSDLPDPIDRAAKQILKQGRILCFDEMEVRDIADAMIVSRLFSSLWGGGMILVATSNRTPDELYKTGLHRDRFLPFIEQLKSKIILQNIQDGDDWRKRILSGTDGWIVPHDNKAETHLTDVFTQLLHGQAPSEEIVVSAGRQIKFANAGVDVALVHFDEMCRTPLAARDYLEIADRFTGILMVGVPAMGSDHRDAARRFMWLVDSLYDRGRFLIVTAEKSRDAIYQGDDWEFEFSRTISRLTEMARYHLPE